MDECLVVVSERIARPCVAILLSLKSVGCVYIS